MFVCAAALEDVAAVNAADSVVLVCVPPLLLMVTPGATWMLEDVAPDVFVVPVGVVAIPVDAEPLFDVAPVSVVVPLGEVEVPVVDVVDDSPLDVEPAGFVDDESEDGSAGSALARPGELTIKTPIPKAAANAPTRPT